MKKLKVVILIILSISGIVLGGCGTYTETEDRYLVVGSAIDFDKKSEEYIVTTEVIESKQAEHGVTTEGKLLVGRGKTIFEAVREIISTGGKRLYWSHTKVMIISEELARRGMLVAIDWASRDQEVRDTMWILISEADTAGEILKAKADEKAIATFIIDDMLKNSKSLPRYPKIDIWEYIYDLITPGIQAVAPLINTTQMSGKTIAKVGGTAVFKGERMVGKLSEEESMNLLIVRNQIKSALINLNDGDIGVLLEVFKSKTKIVPRKKSDQMEIEIKIKMELGIGESVNPLNFSDEKVVNEIGKITREKLRNDISSLVKRVQNEYGSDIFGFGRYINVKYPAVWKQYKKEKYDYFSNLSLDFTFDLEMRGGALESKHMMIGE